MIRNGNGTLGRNVTVRRSLAIGDAIAATVVADKLFELGHAVTFQAHRVSHQLLKLHRRIVAVEEPKTGCHVNLDGAYEKDPRKKERHFYDMFIERATEQLEHYGVALPAPANCRPVLTLSPAQRQMFKEKWASYPRPWIAVCPRSTTYVTRQIQDGVWREAGEKMNGTKFWLGLHPAPPGFVDVKCRHIEMVMLAVSAADLLVTVDTGPMHIAAAVGTPIVAIYQSSNPELHLGDQVDFATIAPPLNCLGCMENICPLNSWVPPCQNVSPDLIAAAANARSDSVKGNEVSAIIPIYRPDSTLLNRCLEAVLPQVSEVIVTRERTGIVPEGCLKNPKIRHCIKQSDRLGFGKNVNFGARHSNGAYLLILNDDVILAQDAVARMMQVMNPRVGIVGHLTRYPDGTVYHAGKLRDPNGGIGFPHVDLRKRDISIKGPMEMENTNGASILVRRSAFYNIGGFDERYFMYCDDDDIAMRMRLHGWQVWYTPHATGIHWEGQEAKRYLPDRMRTIHESNALFGRIWAPYFAHNRANRGLGNFDYLKK